MAAYRYLITGMVQGVGYRYFVLREARRLGVSGYARNLPDGSVEVIGEGPDPALAELEGRLREGPSFASVAGVERSEISPRGGDEFHIR